MVFRGNAYEPWDLEIVGGLLGSARLLMAVEDHGSGRQYVRFAAWPRFSKLALALTLVGALFAVAAWLNGELSWHGCSRKEQLVLLSGAVLKAGRGMAAVLDAAQEQEEFVPRETPVRVFDRIRALRDSRCLRGGVNRMPESG